MEALIMTAQLLLGISILVGLHELGHLVAAKMFGMKVEKYSIGFPPKIFGFKYGETEYSLGALPLGGFVKISGMVDESLDTEKLSSEPQPWEFRAKPAWQRLIVMLGGIIVNVITGMLIFIMMLFINGEEYHPIEEVNKHGVHVGNLAYQMGMREGDQIVKVNGQPISRFEDIRNPKILLGSNSYYTVLRNGQEIDIKIPPTIIDQLADKKSQSFIEPLFPFEIKKLAPGKPAQKIGLQPGDKIIEIAGTPIRYFQELQKVLESHKGKTISIKVDRKGTIIDKTVTITPEGLLGFNPEFLIPTATTHYSFWQAIPRGIKRGYEVVTLQIAAFGKMFSGELSPSKSLGGPIAIADAYGGEWIWERFWGMTAMLSMVLAFMNLLPIPALDGGHVMFLTYEIVSGRTPSDKFLEVAQKIGMVLLLCLMVFAFGNDIYQRILH